ncbi:MAG TPA: response regulator transcription factor [Gaiellaceae bacterium]
MGQGATPWRVAVVDDNDGIRLLLRTLIELEPDLVVAGEAADGRSAIELVLKASPDLVVLDLAMPGTDGLQVLEELRRVDGETRVLVYSGFASPEVERAARELGAVDFVVKGIHPAKLIERLRAVLH